MRRKRHPSPEQIYAMGFDQNDPRPIVNVHKRTTKVNIWMAIGVFAFFAVGAGLIWLFVRWYGHT